MTGLHNVAKNEVWEIGPSSYNIFQFYENYGKSKGDHMDIFTSKEATRPLESSHEIPLPSLTLLRNEGHFKKYFRGKMREIDKFQNNLPVSISKISRPDIVRVLGIY